MSQRQSPQTVATIAPTTNFKEDNLWGKASRFLFGNDVFISYARRDTTIYSLGLANELTKNELSCFLDQWGTPSGKELPTQLVTALKRSNMLILLGTKQAAASAAVATEIREFKKTGRTIIPVSFDGALEQAEWYQELIAGISIAHESSDALQSGKVSEHVVSRIVNAENFTRRSKRLRRYFGLTAASVVIMLLAGALVALFIVRQANAKVQQANAKVTDAENRFREADTRAGQALAQANDAESKRGKAEADAIKALQDQQAAEQKADEAAQNEALAKANADEQRKIADEQQKRSNRLSYIGNIRLAQQMVETGRHERVQQLLDGFRPELAADRNKQNEDLRGYEWYHLWHSSHRILATIPLAETAGFTTEDPENLNRIAVSSRLKQFATASNGVVKVWNTSNATLGQPVKTLCNSASVEYSPDETILAAVDGSKILLWNAETLVAMKPITHPAGKHFSRIAFAPGSGNRLAVTDEDGINIWDISQDKISRVVETIHWPPKTDQSPGPYFAFSPDGTRLGVESGGVIEVWEIPSGGGTATSTGKLKQEKNLNHMLFLPDNQTVAILFDEYAGNFQLWDVESQTIKKEFAIDIGNLESENQAQTVRAALSPDGRLLATGAKYTVASGGGVRLWNTFTGKLLATFNGLGSTGEVSALAFSPDSKTLAIRAPMRLKDAMPAQNSSKFNFITAVQLNDTRVSTEWQSMSGPIEEMALSPDGNLLATIIGATLSFWNTKIGERVYTHAKPGISFIAFSPDSNKYATATLIPETKETAAEQWLVELWDIHSHKPLGEPLGKTSQPQLLFSPDGKTLTTAFENPEGCEPDDACVQVWNVATRERSLSPGAGKMESFEDSGGVSQSVPAVYSPDGKLFIVFRGADGVTKAQIVETTTRKTLAIFHSQDQSHIWGGAFSPDGKTLAIGHDDSTITLLDVSSLYRIKPSASPDSWNRKSKQFIRMLDEHTGRINTVAFSPDGKTIASASDDGTVRLWDTRFYQPLATFSDYSGPIKFMFFSPDGSALITADQDTSVKFRRAATREEVALRSK